MLYFMHMGVKVQRKHQSGVTPQSMSCSRTLQQGGILPTWGPLVERLIFMESSARSCENLNFETCNGWFIITRRKGNKLWRPHWHIITLWIWYREVISKQWLIYLYIGQTWSNIIIHLLPCFWPLGKSGIHQHLREIYGSSAAKCCLFNS